MWYQVIMDKKLNEIIEKMAEEFAVSHVKGNMFTGDTLLLKEVFKASMKSEQGKQILKQVWLESWSNCSKFQANRPYNNMKDILGE